MLDRFYLIVGDADWLERLVPLGVRLVQLRLKDMATEEMRGHIARGMECCARHRARLVVNDHWQLAIEAGADFVHLGQGDLDGADLAALRRAGIRIGISTHDEAELDRALSCDPAYVALGPIWPTRLKKMPWAPQGPGRLREWKARIGALPLVAIGGLTPDRLPCVFAAGADSAAVVTDIACAENPEKRVREWIRATGRRGFF